MSSEGDDISNEEKPEDYILLLVLFAIIAAIPLFYVTRRRILGWLYSKSGARRSKKNDSEQNELVQQRGKRQHR
jgi:hypothetical protein